MRRGHDKLVHGVMGSWVLKPYTLCDIRCSYCCTRVQGRSEPLLAADAAVEELTEALAGAAADDLWVVGGLADAYPSVERDHGLTRALLRTLVDHGARICLVTKSLLVERDTDLFLANAGRTSVTISISSAEAEPLARLEGNAPPVDERIALVHRLHAAGVAVDVNVLPFLPGITDLDALLLALPPDVKLTLSPLLVGDGHALHLGGVTYRRSEAWDTYLEAWERHGHLERTSWIRPALAPVENNPMVRLPRPDGPIPGPSDLRRRLVAAAVALEADAHDEHRQHGERQLVAAPVRR